MITTLVDLLDFVYNIKSVWGVELEQAISRSGMSFNTVIGSREEVVSVKSTSLYLDDSEDLFIVWNKRVGWVRVEEGEAPILIAEDKTFTKAVYAEYNGNYIYIVGDICNESPLLTKEVPPL